MADTLVLKGRPEGRQFGNRWPPTSCQSRAETVTRQGEGKRRSLVSGDNLHRRGKRSGAGQARSWTCVWEGGSSGQGSRWPQRLQGMSKRLILREQQGQCCSPYTSVCKKSRNLLGRRSGRALGRQQLSQRRQRHIKYCRCRNAPRKQPLPLAAGVSACTWPLLPRMAPVARERGGLHGALWHLQHLLCHLPLATGPSILPPPPITAKALI